jgi:hypothetical protein
VRAGQPALPLLAGDTLISAIGPAGPSESGASQSSGPTAVQLSGRQQPAPLAFDLREIEQFRYRVTDTAKKVRECYMSHIYEFTFVYTCFIF